MTLKHCPTASIPPATITLSKGTCHNPLPTHMLLTPLFLSSGKSQFAKVAVCTASLSFLARGFFFSLQSFIFLLHTPISLNQGSASGHVVHIFMGPKIRCPPGHPFTTAVLYAVCLIHRSCPQLLFRKVLFQLL